jgi:hypothetical protein
MKRNKCNQKAFTIFMLKIEKKLRKRGETKDRK